MVLYRDSESIYTMIIHKHDRSIIIIDGTKCNPPLLFYLFISLIIIIIFIVIIIIIIIIIIILIIIFFNISFLL